MREAGSESPVIEDLSQEKSILLDATDWYQRACRFTENVFLKVPNQEQPNLTKGEALIEEIV
jgi:hypothetical protein